MNDSRNDSTDGRPSHNDVDVDSTALETHAGSCSGQSSIHVLSSVSVAEPRTLPVQSCVAGLYEV